MIHKSLCIYILFHAIIIYLHLAYHYLDFKSYTYIYLHFLLFICLSVATIAPYINGEQAGREGVFLCLQQSTVLCVELGEA